MRTINARRPREWDERLRAWQDEARQAGIFVKKTDLERLLALKMKFYKYNAVENVFWGDSWLFPSKKRK